MRTIVTPHSVIAASLTLCLAAQGCKNQDSAEATESAKSRSPGSEKSRKPSARTEGQVWRSLVDEAGRAELRAGGLMIDFGTADQHKYTRGGWATSWEMAGDKETTAAAVTGRKAVLDVLLDQAPAELVLRARSAAAGQTVRVNIDNVVLHTAKIANDWDEVRIPIPEGKLEPGTHEIDLRFLKSGKPRAQVDWLWLSHKAGAEPPPHNTRALPIKVGNKPRRALVAPSARTYSFYLEPAKSEKLVVDVGSDVGARFSIEARVDGAEPEKLWSGKGGKSWREVAVDLGKLAGKAVRLDLVSSGPSGVSGWGAPAIMRPAAKKRVQAGGARPKNVLFILIDTARFDAFTSNDIQTPAYDKLAPSTTRFANSYDNENWTKPSVASYLSGVYPSTHHTKQDDSKLPEDVEIIPQRLKKAGFATAGFIANGYVSDKFGFDKGWDTYRNYIREGRRSAAKDVYGDAAQWLDGELGGRDKSKPFFLYIQTIDPHVTYSVGQEYWGLYYEGEYHGWLGPAIDSSEQVKMSKQKKNDPDDLAWLRAHYKGEVSYHDHYMGEFFDKLEKDGLLDDTMVVITNDHGEELGGRGGFGHGHSLYDELIHSPLTMRFPGLFPEGVVIDDIVEAVDVVPTILDALGMEPSPQAEGQSLLPLIAGKPVPRPTYAITEFLTGRRSIRVGDYKLMRSSGTWIHLFNMADDPGETKDLSGTMPIARRLCEVHLGEGLAVPAKARRQAGLGQRQKFKASKAKISPEVRRELEALGYFGNHAEPKDDQD